MVNKLKQYLQSFVHLFYPRVCNGCGGELVTGEQFICLNCYEALQPTFLAAKQDNSLWRNLSVRMPIASATAMFYFNKDGIIQNLLHQLKYKGKRDLGIHLGKEYGRYLLQYDFFKSIDVVIPVPLHATKQKQRGYNQSELLAKGMAASLNASVNTKCLVRKVYTETQTHKNREERWQNVMDAFALQDGAQLKGKHVLIIDDVLTTGATMEACVKTLSEIEGVTISIASLAYTDEL